MTNHESILGVSIALIGNIIIALGLNFQKLSHFSITQNDDTEPEPIQRQDVDDDEITIRPNKNNPITYLKHKLNEGIQRDAKYLNSGKFWLGLCLTTCGESANFIAYGLSAPFLVAPLGSFALVANCLFAPLILKEKFQFEDILGSILCIFGAFILIASNTNDKNEQLDYNNLVRSLKQLSFNVYLITILIFIMVLINLSNKRIGQRVVLIDISICALFGGLTVISTKVLSSMLVQDLRNAFKHKLTYLALFMLIVTAGAQVHFLNKALNKFHSKIVIPTQYIFFTISVIIASSILFNDIENFPYLTLVLGLIVSFCGVYFLSHKPDFEERVVDDDNNLNRRPSTPLENPILPTSRRIQTSRSNSSFSRVGIGLSPARILLVNNSPTNSVLSSASSHTITKPHQENNSHQHQSLLNSDQNFYENTNYGSLTNSTNIDAFDLTQTPTPTSFYINSSPQFNNNHSNNINDRLSLLSPKSTNSTLDESLEETPKQKHTSKFPKNI